MGDGLFITINYDEENLEVLANEIVDSCIKLVENFEEILIDDPMITYDVPARIGIGLTRGSACCIYKNDNIIDYSGKTLNHSARLMDKARPYGIVCDCKEFDKILALEIRDQFTEDEVCLRGISEEVPIKILTLKDKVKISEKDREPINEPKWHVEEFDIPYSTVKRWKKVFRYQLEKKPMSSNEMFLTIKRPKYINGVEDLYTSSYTVYTDTDEDFNYVEEGINRFITLITVELRKNLEEEKLKDDDIIIFNLNYKI